MRPQYKSRLLVACFLCSAAVAGAQQSQTAAAVTAVPRLVRFTGAFHPPANQPAGLVGATFAIYGEQEGGAPLWTEEQNVELDANGNYTVLLGATRNAGMPPELFAGGESRWLQVKFYVPGEVDLPRVLLVSVPYALKAGDADTLGGRPASAYLLAGSSASAQPGGPSGAALPAQPEAAVSAKTAVEVKPSVTSTNYIPLFTNSIGGLGNSVMSQNGGNIGVGTTAAAISMDVRPTASSPYAQLGVAQTVDYMTLFASDKYGPAFYWDPAKALRFGKGGTGLYSATSFTEFMRIQPNGYVGIGTQTPAATLEVNGNAQVDGGSILAGGGVPAIQFPNNGLNNFSAGLGAALATTGGANTAVGYKALSANTNGYGNTACGAGALEYNTTAGENTAIGASAMYSNTAGWNNTAVGSGALSLNIDGFYNTAGGSNALGSNTTGGGNTAIGNFALFSNITGDFNTATGSGALVSTTGTGNTATGEDALFANITGIDNIAVGFEAGYNVTTSNNIEIGNPGASSDSRTIRIGCTNNCATGFGFAPQTSAYIAGIAGATLPTAGEPLVCIDPPTGQLGTVNCASNGAAVQQKVIDQQQRQIQGLTQQVSDLQQRLSRLESLSASK